MSTVLIVDDSKTSRFMLKRILEANGYEVVGEAENGQDGYDKYCQLMPDFVYTLILRCRLWTELKLL